MTTDDLELLDQPEIAQSAKKPDSAAVRFLAPILERAGLGDFSHRLEEVLHGTTGRCWATAAGNYCALRRR